MPKVPDCSSTSTVVVSTSKVASNFCLKEMALLTPTRLLPMVTVALRSLPVVFSDTLKRMASVFVPRVFARVFTPLVPCLPVSLTPCLLVSPVREIHLQSLGIDTV